MSSLDGTVTSTQFQLTVKLEGLPVSGFTRRRAYTVGDDITSRVRTVLRLAAVKARNNSEPAPWWADGKYVVLVDAGEQRGLWLVHVRSE